jgi:hypothetical protein
MTGPNRNPPRSKQGTAQERGTFAVMKADYEREEERKHLVSLFYYAASERQPVPPLDPAQCKMIAEALQRA